MHQSSFFIAFSRKDTAVRLVFELRNTRKKKKKNLQRSLETINEYESSMEA